MSASISEWHSLCIEYMIAVLCLISAQNNLCSKSNNQVSLLIEIFVFIGLHVLFQIMSLVFVCISILFNMPLCKKDVPFS